jgi:hypothetical protein
LKITIDTQSSVRLQTEAEALHKEQTHQIMQKINEALENKKYCSAAFLDTSQAFDFAQVKAVSLSELFPSHKILFTQQTLPCKG